MGFLDKNGTIYLWGKIKNNFVAKEEGKGLSTNDYTAEDKAKLDNLSTETKVLDDGKGNVVISLLSMDTQVTDDGAGNVVIT